jgi:hypothetical protein
MKTRVPRMKRSRQQDRLAHRSVPVLGHSYMQDRKDSEKWGTDRISGRCRARGRVRSGAAYSTNLVVILVWLIGWAVTRPTLGQVQPVPSRVISLAGEWRFALDPAKEGVEKQFFNRELSDKIHLPGSTDEAKFGTVNTNKPTLDGLYRLYTYAGPAWYQRQITTPDAWRGKDVSLFLERAHWETRVWLDGQFIGTRNSLVAPHVYGLGTNILPGSHQLTICVDNTLKLNLGPFPSILYEGTQTDWNGLIGNLELRAVDPVSVADIQVYPDVAHKLAKLRINIANATGRPVHGSLKLSVAALPRGAIVASQTLEFANSDTNATVQAELPMGENVQLWDEFSPALYDLMVTLTATQEAVAYRDQKIVRFGLRKFASKGTQLTMNDRTIFLRGTLECAIFPRTGYPPTDVASWRRIYGIIKSYGLNFVRFHSWCPPEAAFAAADLEGVMLQAEGPQANIDAGSDPKRDAFMEQEFLRMVRTYGNHPSFCLMTLGNEYGGSDAVLSRWVDLLIKEDPRHLYSSPSAGQLTANRQFTEGGPRGIHGPGTDADFGAAIAKEDRPLTGHEIGQWTFFPIFSEIKKYNGVLAAKNFELVRDDLAAKHLLELAPQFVRATGKQAVALYKEEIEVLLRTPGHAGFSLLDLHDYPGQGTALIGPLDPFWDSKGFVQSDTHRRYCGPTVPLLRMTKRAFTSEEPFTATAQVAHFGPKDLPNVKPRWNIRDEQGKEIASGTLDSLDLPTGKLTSIGSIRVALTKASAPAKLSVNLWLTGTSFVNNWDIWVYPATPPVVAAAGVIVSRAWDDATKVALAEGKKIVLFPQSVNAARSLPGRYLPVFWSPVWFPTQRPNTMGILCDPKHPLFAHFPTEAYSNWQWYELIGNSRSLILDDTPANFRPVVEVIDNFARNHKLGNLFEARVKKGALLVCTIDLPRLAATQPAAKQLLQSLYGYVSSAGFRPPAELPVEVLDNLLRPSTSGTMQRLGARIVHADSEAAGFEAANILDGDTDTIWHTPWEDPAPPFPHEVTVAFSQPVHLAGITCLPRQDMSNGWIKDYVVELSNDGKVWRQAARGSLERSGTAKIVRFAQTETAAYLKFTALSDFDGKPFASLAELEVMEAAR